jgi:hypothetical protein
MARMLALPRCLLVSLSPSLLVCFSAIHLDERTPDLVQCAHELQRARSSQVGGRVQVKPLSFRFEYVSPHVGALGR